MFNIKYGVYDIASVRIVILYRHHNHDSKKVVSIQTMRAANQHLGPTKCFLFII